MRKRITFKKGITIFTGFALAAGMGVGLHHLKICLRNINQI